MKKLDFNEFEMRNDAVEMLKKVQSEFGGCWLCEERSDEIWAVSNCNNNETVAIEYDDDRDTFWLNTTNIFDGQGEEILAFIKEYRNRISQPYPRKGLKISSVEKSEPIATKTDK